MGQTWSRLKKMLSALSESGVDVLSPCCTTDSGIITLASFDTFLITTADSSEKISAESVAKNKDSILNPCLC
jgi:hypothetical protein